MFHSCILCISLTNNLYNDFFLHIFDIDTALQLSFPRDFGLKPSYLKIVHLLEHIFPNSELC